jgi:predicted HTH domain antitoxin
VSFFIPDWPLESAVPAFVQKAATFEKIVALFEKIVALFEKNNVTFGKPQATLLQRTVSV